MWICKGAGSRAILSREQILCILSTVGLRGTEEIQSLPPQLHWLLFSKGGSSIRLSLNFYGHCSAIICVKVRFAFVLQT